MIQGGTAFRQRYDQLNAGQHRAVDTIDGPVMVIAGPGTGKTEVLAMRIAHLLLSEVQVRPEEILCLTFTDEATVSMRHRLLDIIGEDAHRVPVFTFHAFCNQIILNYPEYFGMRERMPVSDLERMDLLYAMLEELPEGHVLRRLKGNIYYDAKNLRSLFDLMKSEGWTAQYLNDAVDAYLESLPGLESFIYKKENPQLNIVPGDIKTAEISRETERMERTRAAAMLFPVFQQRMEEAGRYDFNDMILWVLRVFRDNPDFLRLIQERFQFLQVDEFQDTSGAQHELISLLVDYLDNPNLFIVGDDDQSVFEFQGARLRNIIDLYEKYRQSIRLIVLTENYRSAQSILDQATASIRNNRRRLVAQLRQMNLDKQIVSANSRFLTEPPLPPMIRACFNQLHEEAWIVAQIEALQAAGVALNNVAVLYAQHTQAVNIISLLEKKKIPYWVKRPVNILDLPITAQLLHILRYLTQESTRPFGGEELLFRLMHTPFFGISPLDVATLSIYLQQKNGKHVYWRYLLQDGLLLETMGLESAGALRRLGQNLEYWIRSMPALTLPMLLEHILYEGGVIAALLKRDGAVWEMQVIHSFFGFVKEECAKKSRMTAAELLQMTDRMSREGIPLSIQELVRKEDGVRFYTVFSAKGHEFEHVFLTGVNKKFWEGRSDTGRGFSLPGTLTKLAQPDDADRNSEEVARRLFYVAMTRAKKHLYISFSGKDNRGKDLEPSRFIDEISKEDDRSRMVLEEDAVMQHLTESFLPDPPVLAAQAKKELISAKLEQFVLSVSAMNRYLSCPLAFYYEYILRVPAAKSDALAFGSAVHYALEQLFKKMYAHEHKMFPLKEEMLKWFRYALRREESAFTLMQFSRRRELGERILAEYYDYYVGKFNKAMIAEYNISGVVMDGVPLKGKLDKIEFEGSNCSVTDYKTGSPDYAAMHQLSGPTDAYPEGGDYWRQMVFYSILMEHFPAAEKWRVTRGIFDFIEKNSKDKFVRYTVPIDDQDVRLVKQQIRTVYDRIMNSEFDTGCGKEDCSWCRFVRQYELIRPKSASIV